MKPIDNCPVCQAPVRWVLYDGFHFYDCSNQECPITFSECVWFSPKTTNFGFKTGEGVLKYFLFKISGISVVSTDDLVIINPYYQLGSIASGEIEIDQPFDFSWNNLELLERKIKTLITFS